MWPILIRAGLVALIAKAFSDDSTESTRKNTAKGPRPKISISFAIEDELCEKKITLHHKLIPILNTNNIFKNGF